ncbi:heme exporter protein CcmD [Brevundimonas denitrificans]|nr:heme exporter protein CcmD [Brevundimonas denitrificans]
MSMFDLDMGRYAAFVWPAWGVSAMVLAALAARAVIAARRWSAELKRLEDEPRRAQGVRSTVAHPE